MADNPYSLAKLITINDENLSGGVTDELLEGAPLVAALSAIAASNGTQHKYLQYDTPMATIGFRALNDGREHGSTSDTAVSIDCQILDASFTTDVQTARGYRFGVESFLERESRRALRTAFATLERQVINGTAGSSFSDANGFEGMTDSLAALSNEMVVGAGGSTNLTSVYVIRSADPMTTAAVVTGNDGNIQIDPSVVQRIAGSTTGWLGAYFTNISSYYAYQHASKYSVARLANVDSASATPVVTDDALADVISLFPSDRQPTMIAMNRTSLAQLRKSRTATNQTGAPAPYPTEVFGFPIVVTDQIANDETAVA